MVHGSTDTIPGAEDWENRALDSINGGYDYLGGVKMVIIIVYA